MIHINLYAALSESISIKFLGATLIHDTSTVDERNPAPVEVGRLSHYLQGFTTIPGGWPWVF